MSALERFYYKFFKNLSGTKIFVRLRGVSALEDVRFREVCTSQIKILKKLSQIFMKIAT